MKLFKIDEVAQQEFEEAAAWYEHEEIGLGFEFIEEVDRVLARIETHEKFVTAPLVVLDDGVVRREFVRRFPYGCWYCGVAAPVHTKPGTRWRISAIVMPTWTPHGW